MTHFIGIGGIGMSALAHILLDQDLLVTGSDQKASKNTQKLEERGAKIAIGHGEIPARAQCVIISTAIDQNNPELLQAKKMGLPILHRSELLEQQTNKQKLLAVAGAHGKTSTSALLAHTLSYRGIDPSYLVGGIVPTLPSNGRFGKGEYFVSESDESDGSFLRGNPYAAIITSAEPDHLDFWQNPERVALAYTTFCKNVSEHLLTCSDDPYLQKISPHGETYGKEKADWQLLEVTQHENKLLFTISYKGEKIPPIHLNAIGEHQALNGLAVFALCKKLGIPEQKIRDAFTTFRGVHRRAEYLGTHNGALLYDDYAHHPTEVAAILKALRAAHPNRRIIALFQPHRYTRLAHEWKPFQKSFANTQLFVTDVWSAGETPLEENPAKRFAEEMKSCYLKREELREKLSQKLTSKDLIVTLGAGDITQVLREILEKESTAT